MSKVVELFCPRNLVWCQLQVFQEDSFGLGSVFCDAWACVGVLKLDCLNPVLLDLDLQGDCSSCYVERSVDPDSVQRTALDKPLKALFTDDAFLVL